MPYVFVRGNHDSLVTEAAVARAAERGRAATTQVREVAGLRLVGIGDPRFTPDKDTRGACRAGQREGDGRRAWPT